ncbi:MAG: glycosyltransferase family 2 protein [Bacilli bacterium]|nr:glycosyltransferase family 2 protein [Bacilli bacterium]
MELSIVVPCYNESESIIEFHEGLSTALKNTKITNEIIFIDDGSKDDTVNKVEELRKKDKNVKLISFSRNFGKEAAMLAGLKHAGGKYTAIMDADLQHTPDVLIDMYKRLKEEINYDCVCAYKSSREDEKPIKRTLTSIFYRISNKVSDIKLLPGASDFRVFTSAVKEAIISLPEKKRFLKGMFSWVGFNTIYIPYMPEKRMYGKTNWSLLKLIWYSLGGIISFSVKPLKLIFLLGVFTFIVGFLNFILLGNLSNRTIILFVSFIMLSFGVIALYISRIYNNVLGRPTYIIKKKIGFKD